jgi:hypothetical protein
VIVLQRFSRGYDMKRFVTWTFCAALATPALAANEPARPAARGADSRVADGRVAENHAAESRSISESAAAHRHAVDYTNPSWVPTAEEEAEARTFLEKNCPRRYATVQRGRKDGKVPTSLVRSYFDLEALRTAEPDLYDMKVEQVQLEDKIFGLTEAARGKPTTQSTTELREKVRQLVQMRIEEHQRRLDKLKFIADLEEQKLNILKSNTEQAIDSELERQRSSSERLARQNAPGRPHDPTINAVPAPKD